MAKRLFVYVGTYTEPILFGTGKVFQGKGKGIHIFELDRRSGALTARGVVEGVRNPSFVAFDWKRRFAFAVNELKTFEGEATGAVSSFTVDGATGALAFLNAQPTGGTDPCHVTVHPDAKHIFISNFMSGSVSVFPVAQDGRLGPATAFVQHAGSSVDSVRQAGPHAHSVTMDSRGTFAFVPDLGLDRLMIYRFDPRAGTLAPNAEPWMESRPGAGPRHLAFRPGGLFAYLINELDSTITACSWDEAAGRMRGIETVSTLPAHFKGDNTCSDVHVGRSGEYVYGSNRGHDSIVIFKVDQKTGRLSLVGHESTRGRTPRGFGIDPSGEFLLAGNQDSDSLVVFRIDHATGALAPIGAAVEAPSPVCIQCVEL
jgi:6-phosphogluconolactonase